MTPTISSPTTVPVQSAFETGVYPNLFKDYLGKSDEEIQAKIDSSFEQLFYGDDATERVYYPVGSDMAYISDIANEDVRSEGMSYGMMIAVQMNKKEEFDRLWKWAKTYMYQKDGGYKGYFSWHNKTDGTPIDVNPASDGEE
jgi:oligosaccharide reducing-end xylanase